MIAQRVLLLLPFCCLGVMAFSVGSSSVAFLSQQQHALRPAASFCLHATEGEGSATEEESPAEGEEPHDLASPSDILSSPSFLKRKVEVLWSDIEQVEQDLEAAQDRLKQGKEEWGEQMDALELELKNMQDRFAKQSQTGNADATLQVARKVLEVMDNFDRAFGAVTPETGEEEAIEAEFRATYDSILGIFEKLGIEEVKTVGTEFDYEVHQAVMQRPAEDYEEGIVCEELAKGFVMGDKLIRAAMVAVAA